jgi:hypothetical protein
MDATFSKNRARKRPPHTDTQQKTLVYRSLGLEKKDG